MVVGINARNVLGTKMEGFGNYSFELISRLIHNHPEHKFVLFFDRAVHPNYRFPSHVKTVVLFPPTRHPFLWICWFEWSLPRAMKKEKIDLFWSPDGFCSLRSSIPQIATIHDLNFEHHPTDLPWIVSNYFRSFFPKFARKARHILTVSNFTKNDIIKTYGIPETKVSVAYNGIQEAFRPLNSDEISATRKQYSNDRPYYLFVGSLHPRKNVARLIQAFTAFSKQNTEIDLFIVGNAMWREKAIELAPDLQQRVRFLGHLNIDELSNIMGAAFALTYVPYFEGFGIPLVEAMRCGIPIISANTTCLPEIAGNAALYCDPFSIESITNQLFVLANDKELYQKQAKASIDRSELFSWDETAKLVWDVIENQRPRSSTDRISVS